MLTAIMYVSTGTLDIERILNVSIQYAALHALYINMLHSSTIITKSSCLTDRHTMVHHNGPPCMCSTGISYMFDYVNKKLFC